MLRDIAKASSAWTASMLLPQADYDRCIFVLSHMRGATTALTNVLCSHPQLSGYGETHVSYLAGSGPGRLAVNLMKRKALAFKAPFMVDKILHSHLDLHPDATFYRARAVFLLRAPTETIPSIMHLSQMGKLPEVTNEADAARYYLQRTLDLAGHWHCFASDRRWGVATEDLLADPDAVIASLGRWLQLSPELQNQYQSHVMSAQPGGGDPTYSAHVRRIETRLPVPHCREWHGVPEELRTQCSAAHARLLEQF